MKALVLGSMLALIAVSGAVANSDPAAAHPFAGGMSLKGGNADVPCFLWRIAADQPEAVQGRYCKDRQIRDASLGLATMTMA